MTRPPDRSKILSLIAASLILIVSLTDGSSACDWCDRTAGISVFTETDQGTAVASVAQRIGEAVSTDCFRIVTDRPDYAFGVLFEVYDEEEGKYLSGFSDEAVWSDKWDSMMKQVIEDKYGPYRSRMLVALFYVGGEITGRQTDEGTPALGWLIDYWMNYSDGETPEEHEQPILALMRESMPFDEMVWKWEQTPVDCDIEFEETCIDPDQGYLEFHLTNFKDRFGSPCSVQQIKDINRLVVSWEGVEELELSPGDKTEEGDLASLHTDCNQKYTITTPREKDFNEIKIIVHNSCDILKPQIEPLSKTSKRDELTSGIFRNEWRLPKYCEIKPEKTNVQAGETIEVEINSIQDAMAFDAQEYDRLFVKAQKGKILNGKSLGGMKAFEVGGGTIAVQYQAPDDCNAGEDEIIVHTSCGTSDSLATEPGEEIERRKIKISCDYVWSGSLMMTHTEQFDCNLQETVKNTEKTLEQSENRTQQVTMNIYSGDFTLGESGIAVSITKDMLASGGYNCQYESSRHTLYQAVSTVCSIGDQRHDVSPGRYTDRTTVENGSGSVLVSEKELVISVSKEFDRGKMENLAEQIQQGGFDPDNIEKLAGQMQEMLSPGDQKEIDINILVQMLGVCIGQMHKQSSWESFEPCPGRHDGDSKTDPAVKGPISGPMVYELKGKYIRGEKGDDRITARFDSTYTVRFDAADGDFETVKCPENNIIEKCTINLTRRPDKKN